MRGGSEIRLRDVDRQKTHAPYDKNRVNFRIHPTTYRPIDIWQVSTKQTILDTIELELKCDQDEVCQVCRLLLAAKQN